MLYAVSQQFKNKKSSGQTGLHAQGLLLWVGFLDPQAKDQFRRREQPQLRHLLVPVRK